jgi:hypothetical protein
MAGFHEPVEVDLRHYPMPGAQFSSSDQAVNPDHVTPL